MFPPIFAYAIFFILDSIAFIFDIFIVTSPLGVVINFLATLLYFFWVFLRYGSKKTSEKLLKFRGISRSKLIKKTIKIFGGALVPYVNVWAVYDDYQEEKEEIKRQENPAEVGIEEILAKVERDEELSEVEGNKYNSYQINSAYDEMRERRESDNVNTQEKLDYHWSKAENPAEVGIEEILAKVERYEELSEVEGNKYNSYQINSAYDEMRERRESGNRTVYEEVGGMRTGLDKEDYDVGKVDYSSMDTYTKLASETEENRKKEDVRRRQDSDMQERNEQIEKLKNRYISDKRYIDKYGLLAYGRMKRDRDLKEAQMNIRVRNNVYEDDVEDQELAELVKEEKKLQSLDEYNEFDDSKYDQDISPAVQKNRITKPKPWIEEEHKGEDFQEEDSKTIFEEVGGDSTGLDIESYEKYNPRFNRAQTLADYREKVSLQNRNKSRKINDIAMNEEARARQEEIEKRTAFDREYLRRFGTTAYERMNVSRNIREGRKNTRNTDKNIEDVNIN